MREWPREDLPDDVIVRLDVTAEGVRLNLARAMPMPEFVEMLRAIATAYEQGNATRVMRPEDLN